MPPCSRHRRSLVASLVYVTALMLSSVPAYAQSPGATCGDPDANGLSATDGLIILNVAIGLQTCDVCICDVDGSGGTTASDSLLALRAAVGSVATLACPECEQVSTTSVPQETTTSTTTSSTATTTTTLGGGDGDRLPKDTVCEVEFRASGNGSAGFFVFDVFFDETVGDFVSDDSGYLCRSLIGSDATAFGKDGDQAPGDVQFSYLLNGGFPLPNAFMRCSFIATAEGADTSVFSLAVKTSVNPFFQPIQVTIDVSAADCAQG